MLFNHITRAPAGRGVDVRVDVGRTLALMALGAIALVATAVLYALDKTSGATGLLSVSEAILFIGFGLHVGERIGAKAVDDEPDSTPRS